MNHLLEEARHEVLIKSRSQIEEETAFKWAARAVVTHKLYRDASVNPGSDAVGDYGLSWSLDSEHYFEEALEHAALADESGDVLRAVRDWMRQYIPLRLSGDRRFLR